MRRFLTILLGLALAATAGQVAALHVHAYADHDHPEHHHGPAAHEHQRQALHHDEHHDAAHLKSCDPGQHAVSLTMGCGSLPRIGAIDAQCPNPSAAAPPVSLPVVHPLPDVRVHGPPRRTQAPPRAPPLTFSR